MAPKPKKNTNKPYKPTLADQYETRRSWLIETAETPADKKRLKKDLAIAKSDYVNAKKDKQSRAAGTGYNPAPMSAKAKAKAVAAGKATGAKPKSTAVKVAGVVGKVAGRAKTTAREARDVVTAVGTSARSRLNTRVYRSATGGLKTTPRSKANIAAADKNLKKQLKETIKAATTGKKGTASAQTGGKPNRRGK